MNYEGGKRAAGGPEDSVGEGGGDGVEMGDEQFSTCSDCRSDRSGGGRADAGACAARVSGGAADAAGFGAVGGEDDGFSRGAGAGAGIARGLVCGGGCGAV